MPSLRTAFRSLLNSPGYTAIALLTLALGIGVNTAMFSLVNTLLFKTAPFPEPTRLVRIFRSSPQSKTWPHSAADLIDLREQVSSLERLTWFRWATFSFAEPGQPAERVAGLAVGPDFFGTLGIQPSLGRSLTADDLIPGRDRVIVLGHGLWQRRFAGDPQIIGRTLRIDGESVTVVGVMPEGFEYPLLWGRIDAWRPFALTPEQLANRGNHYINAIGRLKSAVSPRQAQSELSALAERLARDHADTNAGSGFRLVLLHQSTMDEVGRGLSLLVLGLGGFVLLIACANLANLQLARTMARSRDFAIRAALGASGGRLMRELLVESVLLSVVGGAIGVVLAEWITDALGHRILIGEQAGLAVALDWNVMGFALSVSLATGILFGVVPAWTASRTDVNATLKQQSRGSTGDRSQHRLRQMLIVGEVALALALLTGAGFFVRGLQRFTTRDTGWNRDHLVTATLTLPDSKYAKDEQRRAFYPRLLARLEALPGIERVALSSSLPIWAYNSSRDVVPEGRPLPPHGQEPLAYYVSVSPDFFATLQIQLLQGRLFAPDVRADGPGQVVVNEALARQFWPGENPIGKRLGNSDPDNKDWYEVIGVVRDVGFAGYLAAPDTHLQLYRPLIQEPWNHLSIAVRTSGSPASIGDALRRAVAEVDPDLPAYNVRTVEQSLDRLSQNFRLTNQLLVGFAALGLLLAVVGLYGVISGLVIQRRPEFGIRIALGAQARDVLWLVLDHGLRLILVGTVLGVLGSFALLRVCAAVIPALPAPDWLTLALTAAGLIAVALFACWLPARRATQVDPMIALKVE